MSAFNHPRHSIVITGPSGSGKSTLLKMLFDKHPGRFSFCVSHTTRQPRPGEQDGASYHFVSFDDFERMKQQGEFLEWAPFGKNFYGTSRAAINSILGSGMTPILDVERKGVEALRVALPTARYILVKPPSRIDLEQRLQLRGTETPETLQIRLERAQEDLQWASEQPWWNAVIVNDVLEDAYTAFEQFILSPDYKHALNQ